MLRKTVLDGYTRKLLEFTPLQYMLDTVIENSKLAQVLTDDEKEPKCCAMLFGHYLFIGGKVNEKFFKELTETIFSQEQREKMEIVIVFYENEIIAGYFRKNFQKVYNNERSVFHQKPVLQGKTDMFYRITPIDMQLLNSDMENLGMITQEVLGTATYHDMNDFCDRGIGYAFASDHKIYGFCTSEYPSKDSVAVGIEVDEEFQRQGIAKEMTKGFLQAAAKRNLDVYWECWKRNEASVKTAFACGFEKITDYPVLFIELT